MGGTNVGTVFLTGEIDTKDFTGGLNIMEKATASVFAGLEAVSAKNFAAISKQASEAFAPENFKPAESALYAVDNMSKQSAQNVETLASSFTGLSQTYVSGAQTICDKSFAVLVNYLNKTLKPAFIENFEAISKRVYDTSGDIKTVTEASIAELDKLGTHTSGAFLTGWQSAWQAASEDFKGFGRGVMTVCGAVVELVCKTVNAAVEPINRLIDGVNLIPGMDIPNIRFELPEYDMSHPALAAKTGINGSKGLSAGDLPMMAMGGIVNQPTLALVGEAGREAVVPLENNTGWMNGIADIIAAKLAANGGGSDAPLTVTLHLDGDRFGEIALPSIRRAGRRQGVEVSFA